METRTEEKKAVKTEWVVVTGRANESVKAFAMHVAGGALVFLDTDMMAFRTYAAGSWLQAMTVAEWRLRHGHY
jgi:hypothetical protein